MPRIRLWFSIFLTKTDDLQILVISKKNETVQFTLILLFTRLRGWHRSGRLLHFSERYERKKCEKLFFNFFYQIKCSFFQTFIFLIPKPN